MKVRIFSVLAVFCFFVSCTLDPKNEINSDVDVDVDLSDEVLQDIDSVDENDGFEDADEDGSDDDVSFEIDQIEDIDEVVPEDTEPDEDIDQGPPLGCIQGDYLLRFGNFHAHTANSDGEGTPDVAFKYGRDDGGLEVFAITDHLEQLYTLYGMADSDLPDCITTANSLRDENFLPLCGYEYGSGFKVSLETGLNISTGHSNIFFNEKLFPIAQLDFRDYYKSVENCFECVAQFNHPGDEETQTFNEFEPYQPIFNKMALYEFNGAGDVWNLFFMALSKGWYLSPTFNQDNHSANWGTANDNRTGLFMSSFTMEGLKESFVQRRTFATEDKNGSIRLIANDVCWMGSQLSGVKKLKISVDVADKDNETFGKIELFDGFQNIVAEKDCENKPECALLYEMEITSPVIFVARATQTDGHKIVSAPIWAMP